MPARKSRMMGFCAAALAVAGAIAGFSPASAGAQAVPGGSQYLYGSGEAFGLSVQAFNTLVDQMRLELERELDGEMRLSAVLAPGATLDQPDRLACTGQPYAVVLDVDETVLLNLGFEYDTATNPGRPYDPANWGRWEQTGKDHVMPVPGAREALDTLRGMGIAVVFNTNRTTENGAYTAEAIEQAGLGPAVHLETLWLQGDVDGQRGKDGRRADIASRYCVLALAGDQLGDFSDLFTGTPSARREQTGKAGIAPLWGRQWFVLPNPAYGDGLKGSFEEIFPPEMRWPPEDGLERDSAP